MLRTTARPEAHALYESDRVIISKTQRGSTEKDRAKIREICTEAITPTITKGNIGKLLASPTDEDYDIAKDATQWQLSLRNIWCHVVAYDFTVLVNIPLSFDPRDQHSVNANSILVNGVLEHDRLENNHYFAWQELIRRFGLDEELLSDQWFEEMLWKSLDSELRSEVQSDFAELPPLQKGGISLLRLIINRIVQSSQESRRAMEEFIRNFDLQKFPGENVTQASLRIKAVAQSLGPSRLPSDIVHRVLEGFARSSTPTFSAFCLYQRSMISSTLVKSNLRQENLYKTLITILSDLEVNYNELLSGQRWFGLSTGGISMPKSTFLAGAESDPIGSDNDDDYQEFTVLAARAGKPLIPFDIWVKDKVCRNCNEIGHIQRNCPHPIRHHDSRSNRSSTTSTYGRRRDDHNAQRSGNRSIIKSKDTSSTPASAGYKSKIRALISAACDLVATHEDAIDLSAHSTTVNDTDTPTRNGTAGAESSTTDRAEQPDSAYDYTSFLAALGVSPKD